MTIPTQGHLVAPRMAKKLKLSKKRGFIPCRRGPAAYRPLGFLGDRWRPLWIGGQTGKLMEWACILTFITGTVDQELRAMSIWLLKTGS